AAIGDFHVTGVQTCALPICRRADLEKEVAAIYAQAFTVEELNAINTFYSSEAGKQLIAKGPLVSREMHLAGNKRSFGNELLAGPDRKGVVEGKGRGGGGHSR